MQLPSKPILGLPLGAGLLSLVHLFNDFYAGMLPIVLLYQRESLSLTLAQVGLVAGTYNFTLALAQPLFGHLADRFNQRQFALGGVVWGMILAGAWGFAPSFGALFLLAGLAALGSAAFHPTGFAGAGQLATGKRGLNMSIFLTGGSLGHALGPLVAGEVFERMGLQGTGLIALSTLALVFGPAMIMPLARSSVAIQDQPDRPQSDFRPRMIWLGVIAVLILGGLRTWVHWSLATYIPQYLVALDFTPTAASRWLSLFQLAIALGILTGGPLADRLGQRKLITGSLALLLPVVVFFAHPGGFPVGLLVGLMGLLVGLPQSMIIVIGQSLIPKGAGLASGLVIGSSFVIGAAGVTLTGVIADQWGLVTAILSLAGLALAATLATFVLPIDRQTRHGSS